MKLRRVIAAVALIGCAALAQTDPAPERYPVDLVITGGAPRQGQFLIDLFDSEESYLKAPAWSGKAQVAEDGSATVSLGSYRPGRYAVVVVYDKNGDGKLNTGLFRIPREKIGYSNDARGRLGPAKWRDAGFVLGNPGVELSIQVDEVRGKN